MITANCYRYSDGGSTVSSVLFWKLLLCASSIYIFCTDRAYFFTIIKKTRKQFLFAKKGKKELSFALKNEPSREESTWGFGLLFSKNYLKSPVREIMQRKY